MHVLQNREVCLLQIRSINDGFWNTDQLKEEQPERKEKKTDLHSGLFRGMNECWVFRAARVLSTCNKSPISTAMPVSTISKYASRKFHSTVSSPYVCVCVCVCVCVRARTRVCNYKKNTSNFQWFEISLNIFSKWNSLNIFTSCGSVPDRFKNNQWWPSTESLRRLRIVTDMLSFHVSQ